MEQSRAASPSNKREKGQGKKELRYLCCKYITTKSIKDVQQL
jgi:hypothetical protein